MRKNGRMEGLKDRRIERRKEANKKEWKDGRMKDRRIEGRKEANKEKWKDGRVEGQKNRGKKGSKYGEMKGWKD